MVRLLSYRSPHPTPVPQRLLDAFGFLRFVLRRWSEDRCPQVAASLTYTTLLALVPLFMIAVAMLSSMPFFEDVMVRLKVFLLMNLVPEIAGKIITVYMEQFAANAARLTLVGLGALFVMAIAMMFTVERSINAIWRVRRGRPVWFSLLGYVVLLALGPILVGISLSVTTYLLTLPVGMEKLPDRAQSLLLDVVPVAMSTIAFFLVYRIVPHRYVPWRHALIGALIAAVLFEAMKDLFAHYLRLVPTLDLVYGAFAAIPIFLIWLYLSWLVILFGAVATASGAYWRGNLWKRAPTPGVRFRDALEVGRKFVEAKGAPVAFERLRLEAAMPADELEDVLGHLVDRGVVRRLRGGSYALARSPGEITLGDFYAAAVSPGGLEPADWSAYSPELVRVVDEFDAQLKRPIDTLHTGDGGENSGR